MNSTLLTKLKLILLLLSMMFISCSKDNGPHEMIVPAGSGGMLSNDNIRATGNITQTEKGYIVEGAVTISTQASGDVVFDNADMELEFNENGTLASVTGTTTVPSNSNHFEFENPIQADVGFFSGKFLNENRNFEIRLIDERYYFVFAIGVDIQLKLGANDDPDAQKPLTIKSPIGGHIAYICDYTDPMWFYSLGASGLGSGNNGGNGSGTGGNTGGPSNNNNSSSKLGSVSFGASVNSNFEFTSTNPVDENFISFQSSFVMGGKVSFWKVLEATGMYYQNIPFDVNANFEKPMDSNIGVGYRGGLNGTLDLSFDIASFISFSFPIGYGSASIVAETSTDNGTMAKAFVNGLVEPDLSWWPNIIPVAPGGNLNAYGYVEQTGHFDIGLSGELNLETPTGTQAVAGGLQITHEAFTMRGQVTIDNNIWEAEAVFTTDETKMIATPPINFTDGIADTVSAQIDAAIATTEQALADVEAANKHYELELSLRGLRTGLPTIIDRAQNEIDIAVNDAISAANAQANTIASDNGAAVCSTNISSKVNQVVQPYRNALTRLKNAVDESNDNNQTRLELESALRNLASLDKINETVTVTITYGNKANFITGKCTIWSDTTTRNRPISATILTSDQKSHLLEAADNVKYIGDAEAIKFDAQIILEELPSIEELEKLKDEVNACVDELTSGIDASGFTYYHESKIFEPFIVINNEELIVENYNVFSSEDLIAQARTRTTSCNPDGALKKLIETSKKR